MTPELLAELLTESGRSLLSAAADLAGDPFAASRLRGARPGVTPELAAAAVETVLLRHRARSRFPLADRMWFARQLLEQSSGWVTAMHHARRFRAAGFDAVTDLCCGLGGDTLALAGCATVTAVDMDPLARSLTRANADACGVGDRVTVVEGLEAESPHGLWADPDRRPAGRRTRRANEWSPPLPELLILGARAAGAGVKLSPALDEHVLAELLSGRPHELEWVSVRGECRELVVWMGRLASDSEGPRRATLLPTGASLAGSPVPWRDPRAVGRYLLEPDPAVIRADLVGRLAQGLDAHPIDGRLVYLTADRVTATPFGVWFEVQSPAAFSLKALSAALRSRAVSEVTLKTRGSAVSPESLREQLRTVLKQGEPGRSCVVFLTRLGTRPVMLIGERVADGAGEQPNSA